MLTTLIIIGIVIAGLLVWCWRKFDEEAMDD